MEETRQESTIVLDNQPASGKDGVDFFVARQPIFNIDRSVYGYELLFRSCLENSFDGTEAILASSHVISHSLFSTGAGRLLSGKKAFINFPSDLLVAEIPLLLPPQLAVVEILETTDASPAVLAACANLKAKGYLLALDDYTGQPRLEPFLHLVDIIKVDFQVVKGEDRRLIAALHRPRGVKLLAEKVETQEEFESACKAGYSYFQGFFFARPKLVTGREIAGFKLNYLRILTQMNNPELDYRQIGALIKNEISLAAKLLRYINSAAFSWRGSITSLQQALALMGENVVRHWISVAVLMDLARDKPGELITHALVRAHFCESMSSWAKVSAQQQPTLFLIGMFSLLEAILERPLNELLAELPLASDLRDVLLERAPSSDPRVDVFALAKAYEAADWAASSAIASRLGISNQVIPQLYLGSLDWSADVFRSTSSS